MKLFPSGILTGILQELTPVKHFIDGSLHLPVLECSFSEMFSTCMNQIALFKTIDSVTTLYRSYLGCMCTRDIVYNG